MNKIVEFFEKYPITRHIIFKGFEAAYIVFVATILYVINFYVRYDIPIALFMHLFLVFVAVVIIIYIFKYVYGVNL